MQELGGYFFCHLEISHQIKGFPIETVCPFLPAQEDIKYRETISQFVKQTAVGTNIAYSQWNLTSVPGAGSSSRNS